MYIEIYLDYPENQSGICRIHSAISYNSKDEKIKDHQELAYTEEFNFSNDNDVQPQIIDYVTKSLKVDKKIIKIKNYLNQEAGN